MAVAAYFHPAKLNEQQYRAVVDQLSSEGQWPPAGLVHHSCFGEGDGLMVYEVWEDPASLEAFGARLMPVLEAQGVEAGEAAVMPVIGLVP